MPYHGCPQGDCCPLVACLAKTSRSPRRRDREFLAPLGACRQTGASPVDAPPACRPRRRMFRIGGCNFGHACAAETWGLRQPAVPRSTTPLPPCENLRPRVRNETLGFMSWWQAKIQPAPAGAWKNAVGFCGRARGGKPWGLCPERRRRFRPPLGRPDAAARASRRAACGGDHDRLRNRRKGAWCAGCTGGRAAIHG